MKQCYAFKLAQLYFFLCAVLVTKNAGAQAPVISYNSPQTFVANTAITPLAPTSHNVASPGYNVNPVIKGYGFNEPDGVAVDAAGNIYVTDASNKNLVELPAIGGTPIVKQTGFGSPAGIAIDEAGDIYIADNANNVVEEYPIGGGGPVNIGSGFKNPYGVAVDASGNLYVADGGNNAIKKVQVGSTTPVVIGSGFNNPEGVAVDGAGNVYVADFGNNAIKEIPIGGGAIQTLGSGFEGPFDVAVDAIGNLYIADAGSSLIKEIPVGTTSVATIGSGYDTPASVAVDASGNVYVADKDNQQVEEVSPIGGFFISPSLPLGLMLNQATGVISGTPLTGGSNANYTIVAYNDVGSAKTTLSLTTTYPPAPAISYNNTQTYIAGTAITPLVPLSSNVASANYKLTPVTVGSNFVNPGGVAVDAAGNVYVADEETGLTKGVLTGVLKEVPFGVGSIVPIASGLATPFTVAVDIKNNAYISGATLLAKYPPGGGTPGYFNQYPSTTLGLAIDTTGNIYITTSNPSTGITELPANNGGLVVLGSGFNAPDGIALDGAGNIYVADAGNNVVKKLSATNNVPAVIATGFNQPMGMAIDAAQNLYVADFTNNAVKKIPAGGGAPVTLGTGLTNPTAVAIDGTGNVFVACQGYSSILKFKPVGGYFINPTLPAGLSFDSNTGKITGTPLTSSPATTYTVTAYNSAGKSTATFSIAVNLPQLPKVSYATSSYTFTVSKAISPFSPVSSGVAPACYNPKPVTLGVCSVKNPQGIAIDASGSLYVTDPGNNDIVKFPKAGGNPMVIASDSNSPNSIAVDGSGNVYITDNNYIQKIPSGGSLIPIVNYTTAAITSDAAGDIYAVNGYTLFEIPAGTANAVTLYSGGFGVNYFFMTIDPSGNLYVGGESAYSPTWSVLKFPAGNYTPVTIATGLKSISGIAADAGGNVYIADNIDYAVYKIANGSNTPVSIGSGFYKPTGVAVDADGNIYVVDSGNVEIKEIPAAGGNPVVVGFGFKTPVAAVVDMKGNTFVADQTEGLKMVPAAGGIPVTFDAGIIYNPTGLAADASNNVYVTDLGTNSVSEIINNDNGLLSLSSGLTRPEGMVLDNSGNMYLNISEPTGLAVARVPAGGGAASPVARSLSLTNGVAIDAGGNFYIPNGNNIQKIAAGGGSNPIGTGFLSPAWVAVDGSGNLFVADYGNHIIQKVSADGSNQQILGIGFTSPNSVTVNPAGVLCVTDAATNLVKAIKPNGGYYISPFLPAGLSFDQNTGIISGIPLTASPAINYTVTAYNSAGSVSTNVTIGVNLPPPPIISYTNPPVLITGTAITPLAPTQTGVAAPGYNLNAVTVGTGFTNGVSVAVDTADDVFAVDKSNNNVVELPARNKSPVNISLYGGTQPAGIAIDRVGNLYVGDDINSQGVVSLVSSSNLGSQTLAGLFHYYPAGIAVDATGNAYAADSYNSLVIVIPAGGGTPVSIGSGFSSPTGVAVDAAYNVYVADQNNNAVKEIIANGGNTISLASGFNAPVNVAVDNSGNVYVCDYGNNAVKEIPKKTGVPFTLGSGFFNANAVALDGAGNAFVMDNGNDAVKKVTPNGGYFISPALPAGLNFDNSTGIISGTPTTIILPTQYTVTAYNAGGSSTATINFAVNSFNLVYKGPQAYELNKPITPLTPTGGPVALPGYSSSTTVVASGFAFPSTVATDVAGNIYVVDVSHGQVKKILAGSNIAFDINTGLTNPSGLTLDPTGNLYITDDQKINEIPAGGGLPTTILPSQNGTAIITGIAVDAAGNLYYSDSWNNVVKEIPLFGSPLIKASGVNNPEGLAVDGSGNLYIADYGNSAVKYIAANSNTVVTIGSGFSNPWSIAVDASGNVYVADRGNNALKEIPIAGGAPIILASGFNRLTGTAIDGAGNIYATDGGTGQLLKIQPIGGYYINPGLPAGLNLNNTTGVIKGTPTVFSPATLYTVTAYNNAALATTAVNIQTAVLSNNATLANLVLNSSTLSPAFASGITSYTAGVTGATASITLTPTAADTTAIITINGTLVASGSTSGSIPLTVGNNTITAIVTAQDGITTDTYTIVVNRSLVPLTVAANNQTGIQGTALPALTLTYGGFVDGDGPSSLTIQPTASTTATSSSGLGNYPITVSGGSSSKYIFTYVPGTLTMVTQTFLQVPISKAYGNSDFYTFGPPTSGVSYSSSNSNVATVTSAGLIHITGAGTTTITFGKSTGHLTKTLTVNPAALTITADNKTGIQGTPIPIFTFTYTGFVNGDSQSSLTDLPTATTTATSASGTGYYPITVTGGIDPNYTITDVNSRLTMVTQSFLKAPITTTYGNADFYTFGAITSGVNYSSSNTNVATVTSAGLIHIVSAGAITITFGNANGSLSKSLTINPATLTITANNQTKASGSANPTLTVTYSGFVNGDTQTNLTTQPSISTTATTASAAGTYPITASGAVSNNYTITYIVGILTVTPLTGHNIATIDAIIPNPSVTSTGPNVNPALSPNGDGLNDVLTIANINKYPDNKLTVINPGGTVIFEAANYDNISNVFDGHSSINRQMQKSGTYFYVLQYKDSGVVKTKTGFIVLKY